MRYLLATDGTWGDTLPFMFLAKELIRRGHEATVISNEHYAPYATEQNIPFRASTSRQERADLLSQKDLWDHKKGMSVIARHTGVMFEKMHAAIETEIRTAQNNKSGVDMIISHSFAYAAKTAAEVHHIPHACVLISPIQLPSNYRLPVFYGGKNYNFIPHSIKSLMYPLINRFVLDPLFPKSIQIARKKLNLNPIRSFVFWVTQTDLTMGLWPEWYAPLEKDQHGKFLAGFPIAVETHTATPSDLSNLDTWLKDGPAPILVTMGSGYLFSSHLYSVVEEIAKRTGERFIFLSADTAPSFTSKNIVRLHQIPFSTTLPRCKLAIHHGGAGTLAQVIAVGIPHIVIPQSHDQPDNAFRIHHNNLGNILWDQRPTADTLAAIISETCGSEKIAAACKVAADKIKNTKKDGIASACDAIESL